MPDLTPGDLLELLLPAQQSFLTRSQEEELNTLQLWFLSGASILLVLLMLWQLLINNRRNRTEATIRKIREDAAKLLKDARAKAEEESAAIRHAAEVQAKEMAISARETAEAAVESRRQELQGWSNRLATREESIEKRLELLQERLSILDRQSAENKSAADELEQFRVELEKRSAEISEELARVAGLSIADARQELLDDLQGSLVADRAAMIRRWQDESRPELNRIAQSILVSAMQRHAAEVVTERTTATIPLPNEEMKGRIIGKEGRNIRTIEAATGTNLLVDETPQAVVISCFDPVRREVARQVLLKLVEDGRIHPTRVEEIVEKTRADLEEEIVKVGQAAADRFGLILPAAVIRLLGVLKFRYSFSQNVLTHSLEVAAMAGDIAAELGLDSTLARRIGLLHDLGKAIDHENEGTHAALGADLLRRNGEDPVVVNAVAAHHEEVEKQSIYAVIVQICDTISAARPGARAESTEFFLQRLATLERIGNSFPGVENCYAIQAGRELRVIVSPTKISEEGAVVLAHDLAERIEKEIQYPGQIRISVIRETRVTDYAK